VEKDFPKNFAAKLQIEFGVYLGHWVSHALTGQCTLAEK